MNGLDNKSRGLLKSSSYIFLIKGVSLGISLLTIPSYMSYFSEDVSLGFWFTILSLLLWVLNFDLGIGNGLRNELVDHIELNNNKSIKMTLSSAYGFVSSVSIVLFSVFLLVQNHIDWNALFKISTIYIRPIDLKISIKILFLGVLSQMILRTITYVLFALQKAHIVHLINIPTNILLISAVNILIFLGYKNNLILISSVYAISITMPLIFITIILYLKRYRLYRPEFKLIKIPIMRNLLRSGIVFLWLSLMTMIIQSSNEFLITRFISAREVIPYSLYHKIYFTFSTVMIIMISPVWSMVTKAKSEKDYKWVLKIYRILFIISTIMFIMMVIGSLLIQFVFNIWLRSNSIETKYSIAVLFSLYSYLFINMSIISAISNGMNFLKSQAIILTIVAIINIPLAFLISRFEQSFISIVIANIFSIIPFVAIQGAIIYKEIKKNLRSVTNE